MNLSQKFYRLVLAIKRLRKTCDTCLAKFLIFLHLFYQLRVLTFLSRVSPEFPGWKPYQQNANFAGFNSSAHQNQGFRYPQPLHHPLLFTQTPLQPTLPNYSNIEGKSYMTEIPAVRIPGNARQYGIALQQQEVLGGNSAAKYGADRMGCGLKKENPEEASLAVVAPVLVDFSQKNKMQGIPLLCNVSQWLNLPSYERNRSTTTHIKHVNNSVEVQQQSGNNANKTLESLMSLKLRKDPISQLGEAANMILQNEEGKGSESPAKQQLYGNNMRTIGLQVCPITFYSNS